MPVTSKRRKEYQKAVLEFDEQNNILFFRVKQGQDMFQPADIEEMVAYVQEFVGNKKHVALVDFGADASSTPEARSAYGNSPYIRKYRIADAFMAKSTAVSLIANFFIRFNKPKVNTRLFTREASAVKWLQKLS